MERIIKLSVLFLALVLSASSMAEEVYDFDVDGIYYKILENGNEVSVTYKTYRYSSHTDYYESDYTGDIIIPATVTFNGKTFQVTEIGDHAFYQHESVTSVTIPSSVTTIKWYAFSFCTGLENVTCMAMMPPSTMSDPCIFANEIYYNTPLHVPNGSERAYREHICWGRFQTIIGDANGDNPGGDPGYLKCDVNGDGEVNIADVNKVIDAILGH